MKEATKCTKQEESVCMSVCVCWWICVALCTYEGQQGDLMYCTCLFVPVYHYLKAHSNTHLLNASAETLYRCVSVTAQYYVK